MVEITRLTATFLNSRAFLGRNDLAVRSTPLANYLIMVDSFKKLLLPT